MNKRYNVKYFLTVCVSLFLIGMFSQIMLAQVVVIKRTAMSQGRRKITTSGTNQIYSGLRTVGKGMQVCLRADTTGSGANVVTSYTWMLASKPIGSTAAFTYSTHQDTVWFIADSGGQYIVQVDVNGGASDKDTLFASAYMLVLPQVSRAVLPAVMLLSLLAGRQQDTRTGSRMESQVIWKTVQIPRGLTAAHMDRAVLNVIPQDGNQLLTTGILDFLHIKDRPLGIQVGIRVSPAAI